MPRTSEQIKVINDRRELSRIWPHSMEHVLGHDARAQRLSHQPITQSTAAQRQANIELRDAYILRIIEGSEKDEARGGAQ